jgi:hypothetical protein
MSGDTFICAARGHDGRASIWRVSAETHSQAVAYVDLEILRKAPFMRPRVILVGINGGKQPRKQSHATQ